MSTELDVVRAERAQPQDVGAQAWSRALTIIPWVALLIATLLIGAKWFPATRVVSWHYFEFAASRLFGSDGLHVLARHPELQFGPAAILVTKCIIVLGGAQQKLAFAYGLGALLVPTIWLLSRMADIERQSARGGVLIAGTVLLLPAWIELSFRSGHIDDGLALAATAFAMFAIAKRRPMVAGAALAFAVDSKPWAIAFVALLWVFQGREFIKAVSICAAVIAFAWAPFIVADSRTLKASSFSIANDPASALRFIGFHGARTPFWDRPLQTVLGFSLGLILVRSGRWPSVVLAALSVRLLFDPGAHHYYSAGLLLGALMFDALVAKYRVPWMTLAVFFCVVVPWFRFVGLSFSEQGGLRALGTLLAVVVVFRARQYEGASIPAPAATM